MPLRFSSFVMALVLPSLLLAAQGKPAPSKSSPVGSQKKTSAPPRSAKKPVPSKSRAKAPAKRRAAPKARRAARAPAEQKFPTKDRYAEIQTALAHAGYYSGPADGNWSAESVKALQQFQQAEGLEPTGKIDSLTLIRLELGPHYDEAGGSSEASVKSPG